MQRASRQRRVRVLVGDPWPLFRDALAQAIERRPDFQLLGAVDGPALMEALADCQPDVVLVDPTGLDDEQREEIFGRIRRERLQVVFISESPDHAIYDAISLGVLGCLPKDCDANAICDAIAAAARGRDAQLPRTTLSALTREIRLRSHDDRPYLTPREREILTSLAEGHNAPRIAGLLHLGESTVRTHIRNACKKLDATGQVAAVAAALRLGLIE